MAGGLGGRTGLLRPQPRARGRAGAEVLHARDAPVSLGDAAHGARPQLHARGRRHALPPANGLGRPAPDGLGLVRAARRECGDPRGRPSEGDRRAEHRAHPQRDAPAGLGDRLGPGGRGSRAGVLPLDPVAVPEVLRGRACVSQGGARQLVPEGPDRRRQRVRDRRQVRALRHARRREEHGAVVLPDHGLRGPAARGSGADRLAREDQDDPAQLDRTLRGRGGALPRRGAGPGHPGLHDAAGHAVRGDVLRRGAGASVRRAAGRRSARLRGKRGARGRSRSARRRRRTASSRATTS